MNARDILAEPYFRRSVKAFLGEDGTEERIDEVLITFATAKPWDRGRTRPMRRCLEKWLSTRFYSRLWLACKCGALAPFQNGYFVCVACDKYFTPEYHKWEHRARPIIPGPKSAPRVRKSVRKSDILLEDLGEFAHYPVIHWASSIGDLHEVP